MVQITETQKKLLKKLQRGDRKRIAEKVGISTVGVFRILRGDFNNDRVWEVVAEIAAERDNLTKKLTRIAEALS